MKSLSTDVDGDGTNDKVELSSLGADRFRITVITARGATSAVEFTSQLETGMDPSGALYGASAIDGTEGSELIANLYVRDQEGTTDADSLDLAVYTWRSGTLVKEVAPAAPKVKTWHFGSTGTTAEGYRFFDSLGRRYVDVSELTAKDNPSRWAGKITRSVWKKGAWARTSTHTVSLRGTRADPYLRYDGPPVLLGVASVDIDGNGAADELRSYRYRDGQDRRFEVKVTTDRGRVASQKLAAESLSPLVGAAELDGVPGAEIAYHTYGGDQSWTVYTWRKGALVTETAPAMCRNPPGGEWMGCSDESITSLTFSVVDGEHRVVVEDTSAEFSEETVGSVTSAWRSGRWVTIDGPTERPLTDDDRAHLRTGLRGVAFVSP